MLRYLNKLINFFFNKKLILKNTSPFSLNSNSYMSNLNRREVKLVFHYDSFLKTNNLNGSIVECGVASGNSLIFLIKLNEINQKKRTIYAFDTFEGFPEGSIHDGEFLKKGRPSYLKYNLEFVKRKLKLNNIDSNKINFIKGIIPSTFSDFTEEKVSLVNIDLDLYAPIKSSLEFFWPLLEKNGLIMLDEYDMDGDDRKWPGAKKAIDEFCLENNCQLKTHFSGCKYLRK